MDASQAKALRKPFPPEQIGHLPKGGKMLDFAGHAVVTDRLLQVDPEYEFGPVMNANHVPIVRPGGRSGEEVLYALTVCGVTRHEWGDGPNMKECSSDAIRRCAMRFGVALDLWAKEDLQASREEVIERLEPDQPAAQEAANPDVDPAASSAGSDGIAKVTLPQKTAITARRTQLGTLMPGHPLLKRNVKTLDEASLLIEDLDWAITEAKQTPNGEPELPPSPLTLDEAPEALDDPALVEQAGS
jgi:hypothetical protein